MWFFDTPGTPGGASIVERIFFWVQTATVHMYLNFWIRSIIPSSWHKLIFIIHMDRTNVIHNSHLIFGKREIRLAWYEMYRNSHFVLWNWLTFCIQRTNSVNKSCLQYYICTYLLKALWLRFRSSLQCILLKSDWRNHVETGWANIFYGKWNYIAFHEHYNLVSIKSIFFLPYLI